ncbi:type II toxin-antitoxin system RelE/ParE family toxin [Haemophilus haemolyticus]|uniref:type II toxin-antitoxin system RelE/ParE family toxin n=2 Tax=Bacteria TaxID=2 RepID=UPI00031EC780|nr:type II toxin-antitoxin system RelE/ParE family toxin [Haemophilus haemolyticus]
MKFDYSIKWYELAENKLLRQAQYILEQSQNVVIAENFYDAIKSEVDKLSFTADVYRLRKKKEIPILNGKYLVKFLIGRETVYIVDFKSAKQKIIKIQSIKSLPTSANDFMDFHFFERKKSHSL